jgi:hypothetical protein
MQDLEQPVQKSSQSKLRSRGGKRRGAGRKPSYLKRIGISPRNAEAILARADDKKLWHDLLTNHGPQFRIEALKYLTDRVHGKAKQQVDITGTVAHSHTQYRNPLLSGLTDEEFKALDAATRKMAMATEAPALLPDAKADVLDVTFEDLPDDEEPS